MDFFQLMLKNILTLPILCFGGGIALGLWKRNMFVPRLVGTIVTSALLISIGLKGGLNLAQDPSQSSQWISAALYLCGWGFLQPFIAYFLLKRFTQLTSETIAAISASFGSISLMTFITASQYLDHLNLSYQSFLITLLALMEIPGILSGLCLAQMQGTRKMGHITQVLKHVFLNQAIIMLCGGGLLGFVIGKLHFGGVMDLLHTPFQVLICVFLGDMGLRLSKQRQDIKHLDLKVSLFGIYMPLIGALAGLSLSWLLHLDVGSGTLIAVLCASASYIAVPATMRIALPQAQESIYLPLAIGIAFPFNIIFGIPIYFAIAAKILS